MAEQVKIMGKTYYVFPLAFIQAMYEEIIEKHTADPNKDVNRTVDVAAQIVRFSYRQGYMKPDEGKEQILMTAKAFEWFKKQYEEDTLPF